MSEVLENVDFQLLFQSIRCLGMSTCPSGPRASASCSVHLPPTRRFRGAAAGTLIIRLKNKVEDLGSL